MSRIYANDPELWGCEDGDNYLRAAVPSGPGAPLGISVVAKGELLLSLAELLSFLAWLTCRTSDIQHAEHWPAGTKGTRKAPRKKYGARKKRKAV